MRTHTALAALLIAAVALLQLPAVARGDAHAQLQVRVLDKTGAPLPTATVTVYTLDGKPGTTVSADQRGVARIPALPAGMAQVRVEFPGFTAYNEKTTLKRGTNAQTVTLDLAPFDVSVTVTAEPETLFEGS